MIDAPTTAETGRQRGGRLLGAWGQLGLVAGTVLLFFVLVDWLIFRPLEPLAMQEPVDLQTPAMLRAKLDYLHKFQGFKAVLLGDSVVLGLSLREHGDPEWRAHNLARLLEARLRKMLPDQPILVLNLGINGAVPADLAALVKLVIPCTPDLVLADLNLRSFSADFDKDDALTRPWLAEISAGETVADPWKLHRLRDLGQAVVLNGSPRNALSAAHASLNTLTSTPAAPGDEPDEFLKEMELLMKARARFNHIQISPANRQVQALAEFLDALRHSSTSAVVFYARENPVVRDSIIEPERYERLRDQLHDMIAPLVSSRVRFHPGVAELTPERYLDHVHVDADGYRIMLDAFTPDLEALLKPGFQNRAAAMR